MIKKCKKGGKCLPKLQDGTFNIPDLPVTDPHKNIEEMFRAFETNNKFGYNTSNLAAGIKPLAPTKSVLQAQGQTTNPYQPQPTPKFNFNPLNISNGMSTITNILSEFAGQNARKQQDQYDTRQQQLLNQLNPIPASNFQPTQFNQYAQQGGRLNPTEMQEWNSYLDFVKEQGFEGSTDLDIRDKKLGESLFGQYKTKNPKSTINYDIVPRVQQELTYLRDQAQGFARRQNDPNADKIMAGISPVDGWFGSKTSQYRFPSVTLNTINNGTLTSSQDQGLLNGNFQTSQPAKYTSPVTRLGNKPVPNGVKIEQLKDGYFYEDPNSGDLVEVDSRSISKLKKGGNIKTLEKILNQLYGL